LSVVYVGLSMRYSMAESWISICSLSIDDRTLVACIRPSASRVLFLA
jgi:hypothetical protein